MMNLQLFNKQPFYLIEIMAFVFGLLMPFSFSPYNLFWLQFPLLAFIYLSCIEQTPNIAFRRSMLFGLGWFSHGIHWIYFSLHLHGGSPVFLAGFMVIMMGSVLALFPAMSFYLSNRFIKTKAIYTLVIVYPISLMIFEWLRGYVLTGFPWVQPGTAHIDTYLAGYGPVIGGLGIGLMAAITAGLFALALLKHEKKYLNIKIGLSAVMAIYLLGFALNLIDWTQPVGEPLKVSMIQGNIPQSEKWKRDSYRPALSMFRELTRQNWDSDLIIWPETAIPGFRSRVPAYLNELAKEADATQTDVLMGVFVRNSQTKRYYNSVITLDDQLYKKRHLVPLGEYFPFRPLLGFFAQWIDIPLSDIDLGERDQPLIKAAGQTIGVNICFEDAFDRDVLLDLPEATLLVNVSNDAWFDESPQPWQHHQIARMRALETGRVLMRSTNTGVSSVIGPKGDVIAMSPQFKRDVLTTHVQAYQGSTPYSIWSNYLLIITCLAVLLYFYKKEK